MMATVSFEINDFRLGTIGAKRIGSGDSSVAYEGFLKMEEIVLVGTSITKRPPLKYISRTIDNEPRNNQFLSYGEILFYAIGKERAFIVEDGERLSTYEDTHEIVKFMEENVYDVVTVDKAFDASKGEYILAFIGQQPMELYTYAAVSGQTNTYFIYSLSSNKGYGPNNIESFKQVVVKAISTTDYVDAIGGSYVVGSNANGFNIAPDGTVTSNTFKADSIALLGSEVVTASSSSDGITVNFYPTTESAGVLALVKELGTTVYWIRSAQNSLVLSSDTGIFLLVLDGQKLKDVMRIDDKTSSAVKPVLFKQYIIYVDNNGESLSYIRMSLSNNYVLASSVDLAVDNDLFIGRGGIKRLALYYYNNNPNIIALTNDGSCIVGQLNENVRETEIVASLSEWFVPYHINDVAVYKQSSLSNRLSLSVTFEGLTMLCSLNAQPPPLFNRKSDMLPYVDFYNDIRTDLMFNVNQTLIFEKIDDQLSISYQCSSAQDFFKTNIPNYIISDGMASFRVSRVLSNRQALCDVVSDTVVGGNQYVMHAGTYSIKFDNMSSLNHLYYLMFNGQKNKLCGYTDETPTKFVFNYSTGNIVFPYCSRLIIGLAYNMVVCTAQLLPFGFNNRLRSGYYNNLQVTTQIIGYKETCFFVGSVDGWTGSNNAVTTVYVEFKKPNKYINDIRVNPPNVATNALLLYLSSDDVNAPFISNIAVSFEHENI